MRRLPAWVGTIGILVGWPAAGRAGVWLTLAAGAAGGSDPTSTDEFRFDTMHGPQFVAVGRLAGTGAVEAGAGGSLSLFGGGGTPVLLNTASGSAYVAGGTPAPESAKSRGPGGGGAGPRSSSAPTAGGPIPSSAALLGVDLAAPDAAGNQALTATVTDAAGQTLGTATASVPADGWWVLGLGPDDTAPTPPVDPTDPGTGVGTGGTLPPTSPGAGGGSVNSPEPATAVLVGVGGLAAGAWRLRRRSA